MSLFTDLKDVLTQYAQRIKDLAAADEEIKADLGDQSAVIDQHQTAINAVTISDEKKLSKPLMSPDGTNGQILRSKGNGLTEWADVGQPTDEQTAEAVSGWLDEHPEATTTVQDKSISQPKLSDGLSAFIVVSDETEKSFSHDLSGIDSKSIKFYPNAYNSGLPIRYATSKNLFEGFIAETTVRGVTVEKDGAYYKISGTGTGNHDFFNITDAEKIARLAGKTVNVYFYLSKQTTWTMNYLLFRTSNGSTNTQLFKKYQMGDGGWFAWENITIPADATQLLMSTNGTASNTYGDGDWFWFGAFESAVVDTEEVIEGSEAVERTAPTALYIDTIFHPSIVGYDIPTKKYVDEHIFDIDFDTEIFTRLRYLSPENFGAVGDGVNDDSEAVQACLTYASQTGKPVKGHGKYLCSEMLTISGRGLDVFLKSIIYTGSDGAVSILGMNNNFEFRDITSSGDGIWFVRRENQAVQRHMIKGGKIVSDGDCIVIGTRTYYTTLEIRDVTSNNGNCITFLEDENDNSGTEYVFRSFSCHCPNGWVAYNAGASKFYDFTVEGTCKNGYLNPHNCTFIGCRHGEQMGAMWKRISGQEQTNNGPLFKFTKPEYEEGVFYEFSTPIFWFSVDTSEAESYAQIPSGDGQTSVWSKNGYKNGEISCGVRGGVSLSDYFMAKSVVFASGHKIFVPVGRRSINVSRAVYDLRLYESMVESDIYDCASPTTPLIMASDFVIDIASTSIYLNSSYCAIGYNTLTVKQENGNIATVYDKLGNVIFDGTNLGDGLYLLECITDGNSTGRYQYVASTYWYYDGTNETWRVTQIN